MSVGVAHQATFHDPMTDTKNPFSPILWRPITGKKPMLTDPGLLASRLQLVISRELNQVLEELLNKMGIEQSILELLTTSVV